MTDPNSTDVAPLRVGPHDLTAFGMQSAPPALCDFGVVAAAIFVLDRKWKLGVLIRLQDDGRCGAWWELAYSLALTKGIPKLVAVDSESKHDIDKLIIREIRKSFAAGHDPVMWAVGSKDRSRFASERN